MLDEKELKKLIRSATIKRHFMTALLAFLVLSILMIVLVFANIFLQLDWLDRFINTASLVGNVLGFGLSFYIMYNAIRLRTVLSWWLLLFGLGIFTMISNGFSLFFK